VDLDDQKLQLARKLGADHGLNPRHVNVAEEVQRLTSGRGADVSAEVVGATATVETAVRCTRKGGTVTLVGNLAPEVELPLQSVVTRELNVLGSCASSGEYPACIALMQRGAIRVDPLITGHATLAEAVEWFDRLHHGEPGAMKVIVQPNGV
jgi:L-iditol 2-dehydrogenase